MDLCLSGKTAIVTGGARGIGAAVSATFAAAGADVVVDYLPTPQDLDGLRRLEEQLRGSGGSYDTFAGDVSSAEDMEALCAKAADRYGGIDILVNCAGFTKPMGLEEISVDEWKAGLDVNLSGAFYATRAAVGRMAGKGAGRVIYIGSAGSITGGGGSASYAAAKAGINGMVRALSKELAPRGITVNAILPALIETDLLRDRQPDPRKRADYIKRIPVGRLGQPQDVAYLALFLASAYAGYITGQNILVDGGATYA